MQTKHINPYDGDLIKGIEYDSYESRYLDLDSSNGFTKPTTGYRKIAKSLAEKLVLEPDSQIVDLGCGTGISTLEVALHNPDSEILAIDLSIGMLTIARYKFHKIEQNNSTKIDKASAHEINLADYWHQFREESYPCKNNITFVNMNFLSGDFSPEPLDGIYANQVLHWNPLDETFQKLGTLLKDKSSIVWNTASHFYDDETFPSAEFGFRYNDFFGFFLDNLSKRINIIKDYRNNSRPSQNTESVKRISSENGFDTEQVGLDLTYSDLSMVLKYQIPNLVKEVTDIEKLAETEQRRFINEAIQKTTINPKALSDTKHKYDIVPIFKSTKQ
ncbi:MAG: class I SAM-dependent methyltransferase [Candidatus Woesearchaeota archaeon]